MQHLPRTWRLPLLLLWTTSFPHSQAEGICFVQYLLADNNLESFIRKDLGEWIESPAIRGEDLTSWVYLDSRNSRDNDRSVLQTPLPNVWTKDGSQLLTDASEDKHEESYYLRYDANSQKMVVHTTLNQEQNSDDPAVLQSFLETALADCAQQGRTEIFVVFSSHGAGFAGFGGDYNDASRRRKRKLRQSNASIAAALKKALEVVPGVDQYTVVGFDACLMQGLGVVDDYQSITQYFLASEAVEPGHGWAYAELKATSSALELAQNIVDEYVSNPQGITHKTPKLLSLVDTQKYGRFLQSWDALCAAFLELLQKGTDGAFLAYLHRSRSQAIDFPSALDERGSKQQNSALDVGDFLTTFQALCNPKVDSTIATLLPQTLDAYNAMLETKGVGAGTKAGTGLHVTWPHRQAYNNHKDRMDEFLLGSSEDLYVGAPHYLEFLRAYLTVATASVADSVCATGAVVDGETGEEILLLDPSLQVVSESRVLVQSDLKVETDMAIVEYGMDIQSFVNSEERFRKRRKKRRSLNKGAEDPAGRGQRQNSRHARRRPRRQRRLQAEDEETYFVLFGGDVQGNYSGPSYQAQWDRRFFSLNQQDMDAYETVFVYDDGEDGARSIPVLYFPPETDVHTDGFVEFGTSWEEGEDELGGFYGFLTFSLDPQTQQPMDNLILFTASDNSPTSPIQETPRSASGSIAPIVFVDGYFEDEYYPVDTLVGGFNGTVFPWNETVDLSLSTVTDVDYQEFFEADTIVVDIYAYDFDVESGELEDWISFEVLTSNNKGDDLTKLDSPQVFESSAYSSSSPAMQSLIRFVRIATLVLLIGELQ